MFDKWKPNLVGPINATAMPWMFPTWNRQEKTKLSGLPDMRNKGRVSRKTKVVRVHRQEHLRAAQNTDYVMKMRKWKLGIEPCKGVRGTMPSTHTDYKMVLFLTSLIFFIFMEY